MRRELKILAADDDLSILNFIKLILRSEGYNVFTAKDGVECLEVLEREEPDLILLDLNMPRLGGLDVLRKLRKDKSKRLIPVIVLTAYTDEEEVALKEGAIDFLPKPFNAARLLSRIASHIRMKIYMDELEDIDNLLFALVAIIEARDGYTEKHLKRVKKYSLAVGETLGLTKQEIGKLEKGAILHDIGKIGIPDKILLKPALLSSEEYELVKSHTILGWKICSNLRSLRGGVDLIVKHHHEWWDGSGYPDGLGGEKIPLLARIVAVADAFDAMTTERPYRRRRSTEDALEELKRQSGRQFEPEIVKVFLKISGKIIDS